MGGRESLTITSSDLYVLVFLPMCNFLSNMAAFNALFLAKRICQNFSNSTSTISF